MKLKTIPSLGTRKLHLPVVGDVDIVDGVFEVADELAPELLNTDCGLNFSTVDGTLFAKSTTTTGTPSAEGNTFTQSSEKYPKSNLTGMRVADLDELFKSIQETLTDEEKENYPKLKKAERIDFLYEILNSDRVEFEEDEEEDPNSGNVGAGSEEE